MQAPGRRFACICSLSVDQLARSGGQPSDAIPASPRPGEKIAYKMTDQTTQTDPTRQYEQPENTDEQQAHPGLTEDMQDTPDHGEQSYRGSDRLTDKRAIVTGGDSGIGRAVALAFAREGADVLISLSRERGSRRRGDGAADRGRGPEGGSLPR